MKQLLISLILIVVAYSAMAQIGRRFPSEKKEVIDPVTGEDMNYKQVVKFIDDNHFMFEMYMNYGGQEFKSMVVDYTR